MHRETRGGLHAGEEEEDFINIAGLFRKHHDDCSIDSLYAITCNNILCPCCDANTPSVCLVGSAKISYANLINELYLFVFLTV